MSKLAILGGPKTVQSDVEDTFAWPIITKEIEDAVLEVLRAGNMSGIDVTQEFEKEFAEWLGVKYALGHSSGTAALHGAMFGSGIGRGDEVICPSLTYWASCLPVYSLGGTVVFADADPETLCIDPKDIEHRITSRTKAIIVVHYAGMPAEMDAIMDIAKRYDLRVIEDASHAHGALYKGRIVGSLGNVSGFSLMSGKSLGCGEGGMMTTNDREVYERAIIFAHYERHKFLSFGFEDLRVGTGLPWGGYKYRMHQLTSAMGRVQLRHYPKLMTEIDRAMNYFWDLLEEVPGTRAHRPPRNSGTTKGGWYSPRGLYFPDDLGGLSIQRFCEAVRAEGVETCYPGVNRCLHLHPVFNSIDIYDQGKPTRIANSPAGVDVRQPKGSLPVSESIQDHVFSIPWFKHYRPEIIEEHALAFMKVAENFGDLLEGDIKREGQLGSWGLSRI